MSQEEDFDFTDDEIRDELSKMGYQGIPDDRLKEFRKDLKLLMMHERLKQQSQNTTVSSHYHTDQSESYLGTHPARERRLYDDTEDSSPQSDRLYPNRNYSSNTDDKENMYDYGGPVIKKPVPTKPTASNDHYSMYSHRPLETSDLRDDVSETESERRLVKRKVLRKRTDGSKIIDESFTESETGSLLDINERVRRLGLNDLETGRPKTAPCQPPPYRLAPDDPRPASVILRPTEHPHTRNLRKSDPVARFQQFQQSWSLQRVPGEKSHKTLRWNIREQMLAQDQVIEKKAPRTFVPNKYIVPTDKKRNNLRWQIRMDMAQGQMPPHGFYHEY